MRFFLLEVVNTFRLIEVNPLHYQVRFSKNFRYASVRDFPVVVIFKIKKHLVVVNSVFHISRNPKCFVWNRRLTGRVLGTGGKLEPAEIYKKFTRKQKKW